MNKERSLSSAVPTRHRIIGLALAFAAGMILAIQARINGALGTDLGNGVVAAMISFVTGLVLLGVIAVCRPSVRHRFGQVRSALRDRRLVWWQLLGGISGAFLVLAQGVTVTAIGVATFTVAVVGGQLVSSLVVDRAGLGPAGKAPVTLHRAVGAAVALVAVLIATAGGLTGGAAAVALAVLPAVAGFGTAWQQAVNGRVGVVGGPVVATVINFAVGTIALIIATAVSLLVHGLPPALPAQPWLYLGGVIGVLFIGSAAMIVRWVGVLLLGMTSIAGQLTGAVLVELVAPTEAGLSSIKVVGCVLTLVGVLIAVRPRRRSR
ncbi:MAG: DMT family transporter [Microlunatus sp.]|nr:DMT family transporter [Microlunatus sp.]